MSDAPTVRREGLLPVLLQQRGGVCHGGATCAEPGDTEKECVSEE